MLRESVRDAGAFGDPGFQVPPYGPGGPSEGPEQARVCGRGYYFRCASGIRGHESTRCGAKRFFLPQGFQTPHSVHTWEEAAIPAPRYGSGGGARGSKWHESGRQGGKETQSDRDRNGERETEIELQKQSETQTEMESHPVLSVAKAQ